jgi:hypothetical protein
MFPFLIRLRALRLNRKRRQAEYKLAFFHQNHWGGGGLSMAFGILAYQPNRFGAKFDASIKKKVKILHEIAHKGTKFL